MTTKTPTDPTSDAGDVSPKLVEHQLVKAHIIAALTFMMCSMLTGLLISLQFFNHNPIDGMSEYFSFGRLRLIHTNQIAYGFLVNGFVAMLYYAVPRMTGRPVLNKKLGQIIFVVWQSLIVLVTIGFLMGKAQAVEWGETPTGFQPGTFKPNFLPLDFLIEIGALLVAAQFLVPIAKSVHKRMYVSLWYLSAGIIWLILTYVMGNTLPEWTLAGSSGGATVGLFIHDLVGLFVTPMGWGLMYFFVPIILRKPIWSHALSVIGFWALAFFYPLNGVHHFLLSSIPMSVQYGAIVSTIAVEIVVTTVIVNFFATMWGRGAALRTNLPIRWFYTGMVCYFITCLQCSFQTTLTFQEYIHFTDWVPGHAHLVMLGVFSFWIYGMITWIWPRLTGCEWHNRRLNHWHYWLSVIGLIIMFTDLTAGGLVHGFMFKELAPWMSIVDSLKPFWIIRTVAGTMIVVGQLCFTWNIYKTAKGTGRPYDYRVDLASVEEK